MNTRLFDVDRQEFFKSYERAVAFCEANTTDDYWRFPLNLASYATANRRRLLFLGDDLGSAAVFSVGAHKEAILCGVGDTMNFDDLKGLVDGCKDFENRKLRSLSFDGAALNLFPVDRLVKSDNHFLYAGVYTPQVYINQSSSGRYRRNRSNSIRRGDKRFCLCDDIDFEVVDSVFSDWAEWAKTRHFMVFTTHYKRFILGVKHGLSGSAEIQLVKDDRNDEFVGVVGWEVFRDAAVIVLMKHKYVTPYFSSWLWVKLLTKLTGELGCKRVFCGSTADELKWRLGLVPRPTYRVSVKTLARG